MMKIFIDDSHYQVYLICKKIQVLTDEVEALVRFQRESLRPEQGEIVRTSYFLRYFCRSVGRDDN